MRVDHLEMELIALGRQLEVPETPDLVAGALRRVSRPPRRAPRRRLRPAMLVVIALLLPISAALALSSDLRERVRDWLGSDAIVIEEVETLPPIETGRASPERIRRTFELIRAETARRPPIAPGVGVPLATARTVADFALRLPAGLGRPRSVYLAGTGERARVSIAWSPRPGLPAMPGTRVGVLVTQLRGSMDAAIVKQAPPGTDRRFLTIGGWNAVALLGAPHAVTFRDVDGALRSERTRLAANTLLISHGELLLRIEARAPLATLSRIAEDLVSR